MLIQCQSCTHKFRLNLERLPARKTFVRCKNCGTPIYVQGEEEEPEAPSALPESITVPEHLAERPVIPPWMAGAPPEDGGASVLVTCPQCESRYRVPREPLRRPDIKLKCTQCDHVFAPPPLTPPPRAEQGGAVLSREQVARATEAAGAPEFPPYPRSEAEPVIPAERVIAEPDDRRMSALFEDMAPEPGIRRPVPPPPGPPRDEAPAPPVNADQAYLDAVDLGAAPARPAIGTVPDEQKYSLFLKPGEIPAGLGGAPPAEAPTEAPVAAAEPEEELPPLEAPVPPPAPPQPGAPPEPLSPAAPPPRPAAEAALEVPALPMVVTEPPTRKPPDKHVVPDQQGWFTTQQRYIALAVAAAIVLVGAGIWTAWLWNAPGASQPYTIETGRVHQLALDSALAGRYVLNKASGQRLFVVQGTVENRFPAGTEISWIRLRGTAYADRNQTQTLGTAFAFIGNVLTDAQLGAWELDAVQAFHAYNNGRDNSNFRIPSGARIPFQLVFAGISAPVGRTIAQAVSYHRNNLTVYVDSGR